MDEENERISELLYLRSIEPEALTVLELWPIVPELGRHEFDFLASGQARPRLTPSPRSMTPRDPDDLHEGEILNSVADSKQEARFGCQLANDRASWRRAWAFYISLEES